MSYINQPAIWFAVGACLCVFAVLVLLVSLTELFRKYRKFGVSALFIGLILSLGAILIGDWNIPECYDSEGEFIADDLKCVFTNS